MQKYSAIMTRATFFEDLTWANNDYVKKVQLLPAACRKPVSSRPDFVSPALCPCPLVPPQFVPESVALGSLVVLVRVSAVAKRSMVDTFLWKFFNTVKGMGMACLLSAMNCLPNMPTSLLHT